MAIFPRMSFKRVCFLNCREELRRQASKLVKDFVKFLVWASEKEIAQLNAL